ncbi:hypothetical protein ACWGJ2_04020 [Streptomyces sp. NPDC054796]
MTAGADLRLLRAAVFTAVCVALSAAGHVLVGGRVVPLWSLGLGCAVVFAVAAPLAGRERSLPGIAALLAVGQLALHTLFACGRQPVPRASSGSGGAGSDGGVVALAEKLLCNEHAAGSLSESEARRVVSDAGLSAGHLTQQAGQAGASGAAHLGHAGHAGHGGAEAAGSALSAGPAVGTPLECLRDAARAALSLLDGPMLLGHLLAALALGWLLRRGEAALWRLVRLSAESAVPAAARLLPVRALRTALAWVRALRAGLLPQAPAWARAEGERDESAPASALLQHSVHRRGPPRTADVFALAA